MHVFFQSNGIFFASTIFLLSKEISNMRFSFLMILHMQYINTSGILETTKVHLLLLVRSCARMLESWDVMDIGRLMIETFGLEKSNPLLIFSPFCPHWG